MSCSSLVSTALSLHGSLTPQRVCLLLRSLPSKHWSHSESSMYARHFTRSQILLRSVPSEQHCTAGSVLWRPLEQFTQHALLYLGHPVRKKEADGCRWSVLVPPAVFLSLMMIDPSVGMNDHLWEIRAPFWTWWKTMFVCLDLPPLLKMKNIALLRKEKWTCKSL